MLKMTAAALAAIMMTTAATAAAPADPLTQSSAILKLDGLNLATPEGQRVLAIRMGQAARAVCGSGLANIHLSLAAESQACYDEVKADIRTRIEQRTAAVARPTQLAMR